MLEVIFENKRVGLLHLDPVNDRAAVITITVKRQSEMTMNRFAVVVPSKPIYEQRNFKLKLREFLIDADKKPAMSEEEFGRVLVENVAPYAEMHKCSLRNADVYQWRALPLETFEDYEWIFDLPEFDPADAPLDLDASEHPVTSSSTVVSLPENSLTLDKIKEAADAYLRTLDKIKEAADAIKIPNPRWGHPLICLGPDWENVS
jgi:hypothetical protein